MRTWGVGVHVCARGLYQHVKERFRSLYPSRQRCFYSNNVLGGGINSENELTPIEKAIVET